MEISLRTRLVQCEFLDSCGIKVSQLNHTNITIFVMKCHGCSLHASPHNVMHTKSIDQPMSCFTAAGEANADVNQTHGYYDCALTGLIRSWRRDFGNPSAWFGVVMLAAYINDSSFPPGGIAPLRGTQLAALGLPNVALVAATDLGDPGTAAGPGGYSELHSVHPRNKKPLGARLAAAALDMLYGSTAATREYVSPRYLRARQLPTISRNASSFEVKVQITFDALPSSTLPLRLLAKGEPTSADPHGLSSSCPVAAGVVLAQGDR
jgi:hypothetical protein